MDFVSFIFLWIVQTESKHKINKTRSELWHVGGAGLKNPYTYCIWGLGGFFFTWLIKVNNLTEFSKCLI